MPLTRLASGAVLVLAALSAGDARGEEEVSCCDAGVNVGFSERDVRDGAPFEGIAGTGDFCTADEGVIVAEAPPGATPEKKVYVAIVSNLGNAQVGGWSFGVLVGGAAHVLHVTTAGTAADTIANGGRRDPEGSFNKTQVIDPAKNGGRRGFISAIAHTTQDLRDPIFPPVGTQSVAVATLAPEALAGAGERVASLRFRSGLVGWGQPVANVITVQGNSAPVCNFDAARVTLVFRAGPPRFRRGDANGDRRVDIADPIWILNGLFLGGPAFPCADAADANDDGLEDAADAILLIGHIFVGSRAPPAPGPEACGPDPSGDALECAGGLTGCS
jgi:hypothetical protein